LGGGDGGHEGKGGAAVLDIKSNTPAAVVRTAKSQGTQSSPGPHPPPRGQPGGGGGGGGGGWAVVVVVVRAGEGPWCWV